MNEKKKESIINACFFFLIGTLIDVDSSDEFEEQSKSLMRLVWDLLENYQSDVLFMLTQDLLKTLAKCPGQFQNISIAYEVPMDLNHHS